MEHSSDVTVIVPTRNEAANIGRFLASIPNGVPLIVVDKSDDETPHLVQRLRPNDTTLLRCDGTLTEARQVGALHAKTRWLLFTDADVAFALDYFERLDERCDAAADDVIYGPKLSHDEYRRYYRGFAAAQRFVDRVFRIPAASGSNLLVSADAFRTVGGFDTELTCNEDSELGWRLGRAGFRCRFDAELVVWAIDHRRLRRGRLLKTAHTVARCVVLYFELLPRRWRNRDWGYWSERRPTL